MSGWLTAILVGALTGILSGFGVGGGTLLLIYLTVFSGMDQHMAQGINLLYFLPAAAAALPSHIRNGYVDKASVFPAIAVGLACTAAGAWAATAMDVLLLKRLFGGYLLYIGVKEFKKKEG